MLIMMFIVPSQHEFFKKKASNEVVKKAFRSAFIAEQLSTIGF